MSDVAAKKLEDQLTCAVCLDQYKDPRSLSCLHSFCTECVERLIHVDDENKTVTCPTCRSTTQVIQGNVKNLPVAFQINQLLEVHDLLQKSSGTICSNQGSRNCSKDPKAQFYCPQCDQFLCESCNDFHGGWSAFSTHKVMGVEEVAHKATNMVSVKPTPPMECPRHAKLLEVYCIECDQPICYLCTIKDHKGHDHTLVDDAYEECKQKIKKRIESLEDKIKARKEEQKDMEENKTSIHKKTKENQQMINSLCDDLVKRVEQLRRHGLQVVEMGTASYIAYEDEQIEKEQGAIQTLNDCKNHVERSLEKSTPTQLLLIAKQITERFDELVGFVVEINSKESPAMESSENQAFPIASDDFDGSFSSAYYHSRNYNSAVGVNQSPFDTRNELDQVTAMLYEPPSVSKRNVSLITSVSTKELEATLQDLGKNILIEVSLQYPQPMYERCELVTDLPDRIRISRNSLCTATFSLLFNGHSMAVNTNNMSCFFEMIAENSLPKRTLWTSLLDSYERPPPLLQLKKEKVSCSVDYFHDNTVKYQVQFTPSCTAGSYQFTVHIGTCVINNEIKVDFFQ